MYVITNPDLGPLDMHKGEDVMALDRDIRTNMADVQGWSYSFDGVLTIDAPPNQTTKWGEAVWRASENGA